MLSFFLSFFLSLIHSKLFKLEIKLEPHVLFKRLFNPEKVTGGGGGGAEPPLLWSAGSGFHKARPLQAPPEGSPARQ